MNFKGLKTTRVLSHAHVVDASKTIAKHRLFYVHALYDLQTEISTSKITEHVILKTKVCSFFTGQ
jgi:hypothetical protein